MNELLNVLSFYADKKNYYYDKDDYCGDNDIRIYKDNGSKARKILKKLVKEELSRAGIENNL